MWVANCGSNSVTELDARTGALVRVLSAPSFGFTNPDGIASDGTNVWVTNSGDDSVTGFPATG